VLCGRLQETQRRIRLTSNEGTISRERVIRYKKSGKELETQRERHSHLLSTWRGQRGSWKDFPER
jgi:hypothetical protein